MAVLTLYSKVRGHCSYCSVPLATGGEGSVHSCYEHPELLIKRYHDAARPKHLEFVIETVRELTFDLVPPIAEVMEPVRPRPGAEPFGFFMEKVVGTPLLETTWMNVDQRIEAALTVARTYAALQRREAWNLDGHPGNVLVDSAGRPRLIDADSLSFGEVIWPDGSKGARNVAKGTQEWSPVEYWGKSEIQGNEYAAAHLCSLVIWVILKDQHPALCRDIDGRDAPLQRFLVNLQFGRFFPGLPRSMRPADDGIPWAELPDRVRWLFTQAFSLRGLRDPMNRPLPEEFVEALETWQRQRQRQRFWLTAAVAAGALLLLGAASLAVKEWSQGMEQEKAKVTNTQRPPLWRQFEAEGK